ncbi:putative serine/threonine protein phosphatase [Cladochytrium tenue]|nr:putative serine/threonine protein phosphatase [Cladochytrium tenue]
MILLLANQSDRALVDALAVGPLVQAAGPPVVLCYADDAADAGAGKLQQATGAAAAVAAATVSQTPSGGMPGVDVRADRIHVLHAGSNAEALRAVLTRARWVAPCISARFEISQPCLDLLQAACNGASEIIPLIIEKGSFPESMHLLAGLLYFDISIDPLDPAVFKEHDDRVAFDCMISYSWAFQPTVLHLCESLRKNSVSVWIDVEEMRQSIFDSMTRGVSKSRVIIVCLSKQYEASLNCQRELFYLASKGKPVVLLNMDGEERSWSRDVVGHIPALAAGSVEYDSSNLTAWESIVGSVVKALKDAMNGTKVYIPKLPEHRDTVVMDVFADLIDWLQPMHLSDASEELLAAFDDQTRDWVIREIRNWLETGHQSICILKADPGLGKSTIASIIPRLCVDLSLIPLSFIFVKAQGLSRAASDSNPSIAVALRTIALALARSNPAAKRRLEVEMISDTTGAISGSNAGVSHLFRELIKKPVLSGSRRKYVIVLDGLSSDALVDLFDVAPILAPEFKLFVTCASLPLENIRDVGSVSKIFEIQPADPRHERDLSLYCNTALSQQFEVEKDDEPSEDDIKPHDSSTSFLYSPLDSDLIMVANATLSRLAHKIVLCDEANERKHTEVISAASVCIAFISREFENSTLCKRDLLFAASKQKPIVVVQLDSHPRTWSSLVIAPYVSRQGEVNMVAVPPREFMSRMNLLSRFILEAPDATAGAVAAPPQSYLSAQFLRPVVKSNEILQTLKGWLNPIDFSEEVSEKLDATMAGSREWIFSQLDAWADVGDPTYPANTICITALPGFGKSFIATSIAEKLARNGRLVGCLLCRFNQAAKSDPARLISSLAFQLAYWNSDVAAELFRIFQEDSGFLLQAGILSRFGRLIVQPLSKLDAAAKGGAVVIDALDECAPVDSSERADFLRALADWSSNLPDKIRLIATSRATSELSQVFQSQVRELSESDAGNSEDLFAYAQQRVTQLDRRRLGRENLQDICRALVDGSHGLFLWLTLASDFVEKDTGPVLDAIASLAASKGDLLDNLYLRAIDVAHRGLGRSWSRYFKLVLSVITVAKVPVSQRALSVLSGCDEAIVKRVLSKIRSLVVVSDQTVKIMHKTFTEFLSDPRRCTDTRFLVDTSKAHWSVASFGLQVLHSQLKMDMSGVRSSNFYGELYSENGGSKMDELSEELVYSSAYTFTHLFVDASEDIASQSSSVIEFLCENKLLNLVEALSLQGKASEVLTTQLLPSRLPKWLTQNSRVLLEDLYRLVTTFHHPIDASPLQVYISAMSACPRDTALYRAYGLKTEQELSKLNLDSPVYVTPPARQWPASVITFEGHESLVTACAWSPDGRLVASTGLGGFVLIFDPYSGRALRKLDGHDIGGESVCFHPNGRVLASGGEMGDIRLWQVQSGRQLQVVEDEHQSAVNALRFSPDGAWLVSGSDDGSVVVWRVADTIEPAKRLDAFDGSVSNLCFSPDGRNFAVAGNPANAGEKGEVRMIKVPEFETAWTEEADGRVLCVVHDGSRILYGVDSVIHVALVQADGVAVVAKLKGHEDRVTSLALAAGGNILMSAGRDHTVRLWNLADGSETEMRRLSGHSGVVYQVAVNPEGRLGASASEDQTVRIWRIDGDVDDDDLRGEEEEAVADEVTWISLAPDGAFAAAGSKKKNEVRMIDARRGHEVAPLGGGVGVTAPRPHAAYPVRVAVSPSGRFIASGGGGGQDPTVAVWEAASGAVVSRVTAQAVAAEAGVTGRVDALVWSSDESRLVVAWQGPAGNWWAAWLWDDAGGLGARPVVERAAEKPVVSLEVSRDGRWVVGGEGATPFRILTWDAETGVEGRSFSGHEDYVMMVALENDGRVLFSASVDCTLPGGDGAGERSSLDVDRCIERLLQRKLLSAGEVREVCDRCKEVLLAEGNVRHVTAPVTLVGDVHGQFYDVLEIFRIAGRSPDTNYVFLGDYVDRGYYSVETISLLVCLKLRYPERMTLLRGNHESRAITQTYGFYAECQRKYGDSAVWTSFTDLFDYLVLAVVIEDSILCVHGGLSPSLHTIDQIRVIDRFREIPHEGPMADLVWSDPIPSGPSAGASDERGEFLVSPRGAGYLFGGEATRRFLHLNGLGHVCRAHQLCMEGYQTLFDDALSTVWSAPNYCYRAGNLASVLEVGPGLERFFNVFGACPEEFRDAPGRDDGGGGGATPNGGAGGDEDAGVVRLARRGGGRAALAGRERWRRAGGGVGAGPSPPPPMQLGLGADEQELLHVDELDPPSDSVGVPPVVAEYFL